VELEDYLARKRLDHKMKKVSVGDVLIDKDDPIMANVPGYSPF